MKYLNKNNEYLFKDFKNEDIVNEIKNIIELYISVNYGIDNIYMYKIIVSNKSKIVLNKFYYISPKNKKDTIYNQIKYRIKRLLE